MAKAPYYILFAGVNGAGKSTFFRTGLWQNGNVDAAFGALPRVNPDEILVEHGWDSHSEAGQLKAGRIAVESIRSHLAARRSFNQETTLTGRMAMRNIATACELGYRVVMFYIGLSDPEIANERIAKRDSLGGHFISPDTVARRFDSSLENLSRAVPFCEEIYLYDNTNNLELEARFARGVLAYYNPFGPKLAWVERTVTALGYIEIDF